MRSAFIFTFASLLIYQVSALVIVDSAVASACVYYMKQFNWGCGGTGQGKKYYACRCGNIDWLGSVTSCVYDQTSNEGKIDHALKHIATRCLQKGDFHYSLADMKEYKENATSYIEAPTANDTVYQVYHPLGVNETAFKVYMRSFNEINHHVFKSQWLGWGLLWYWVFVIGVFAIFHISSVYLGISLVPRAVGQAWAKYLKPTRFWGYSFCDALVMGVFLIFTVLATSLSYSVQLPNVYINDVYFLTLDLIGYRSAIISFSLLPVAFIFGLRNNPFTLLTGIARPTFIKYHAYVALIMSIEALIHSAMWTAYAIRDGGYSMWSMDAYWKWGIVGTVLLFVLIGQSFKPLRDFMYELFLVVHKILGWIFIVSMWYHCNTLGWMGWVYAMIALAVYDRVMRWGKILILNRGLQELCVKIVDERTLVLIFPKPLAYDLVYKTGSSIYITFLHSKIWGQCLESHPFTIISSPTSSPGVLKIYVRVKRGATKSLLRLPTNEKGQIWLWCLLDGPYGGETVSHKEEDDVVFIAGGLGLCSLLPHMYEKTAGTKLVWIVNNLNELHTLRRDIAFLRERGCEVKVLAREGDEYILDDEKMDFVEMVDGRPDVKQWVTKYFEDAKSNNRKDLYVYSCGPGDMDVQVESRCSELIQVGSGLSVHHRSMNFQW